MVRKAAPNTQKYKCVRKRCIFLCTSLVLLVVTPSAAQSLVFSQYYFSPPNINPSLASLEKDLFLGVNHRSQWRDLTVPYNATLFSMICPVFTTKPSLRHLGGFGIAVSKESAGIGALYQSYRGHFSAAYNLPLDFESRNLLAMGIQGGFVQKRLNEMALQWGSQYNPVIGYDPTLIPSLGELHSRITYPTFTAGITWYHVKTGYQTEKKPKSFVGFSLANINRPDYSLFEQYSTRAPLIYSFQSGVTYKVQKKLNITHTLLATGARKTYHVNFGTYVIYSLTSSYNIDRVSLNLLVGSWYRLGDAFVLSTGLQARNISVALSYDFNSGNTLDNTVRGGAYEVSLSYRIVQKKTRRRYAIPLI